MTQIFLITDSYPFGLEEPFLETETKYLPEAGDVCILPKSTGETTRPLPDGVRVDIQLAGGRDLVGSIFRIASKAHIIFSELVRVPALLVSPKKVKKLLVFIGEAMRQYKVLDRLIASCVDEKVVLYSYWAWETAYALSLLKSKYPQIRAICRAHGFDIYLERHAGLYVPLNKSYLKNLDKVCVASEHGRAYMEESFDIPRHILRVDRLGVGGDHDLSSYNGDEIVHVVSCSHFVPVKRIDRLVAGLRELEQVTDRRIKWTHIGDGEGKEEILELAADLRRTCIDFVGHIPNTEVLKFYADNTIDVFVNTSESESCRVSIMEATSGCSCRCMVLRLCE